MNILELLKAAKEIVPQLDDNLKLLISFLQQIEESLGKFRAGPNDETEAVEAIESHFATAAMPTVEAEIQKGKLTDFLAKFGPVALKILLSLLAA